MVSLNEEGDLEIWQEPFHNTSELTADFEFNYSLPLFVMDTEGNVTQYGWLSGYNKTIVPKDKFLLVNPGRIAYARIRYGKILWLIIQEKFSAFDEATRAMLLTDTWSLVR
jgi:hypothetical protein